MIPPDGLAVAVDRLPIGPIVVAIGGGPDSAVAAWLAIENRHDVRAVHVHHGTSAADLLEEAAHKLAAHLGVPLEILRVDVAAGASLENAARIERHRAIESTLGAGETIVTGHHLDDQAETVLWHIFRGAGATGVAGIPQRRDRWVRPLLGIRRDEIRAHAVAAGLPFADDPANDDPTFTRTRLRTEVIPFVESTLGRPIVESLGRLGELARLDDDVLQEAARHIPFERDGDAITLPVGALLAEPPAIGARAIRAALRLVRGPYAGSAEEVAAVRDVATGGSPRTLEGAWRVVKEGPHVAIHRDQTATASNPVPLATPGITRFQAIEIHTALVDSAVRPLGPARVIAARRLIEEGNATVGVAAAGQKIDIGPGSKLVRDAMAEAGVPHRLRPLWPVVSVGGKIGWIVGVRVAPWLGAGWPRTADGDEWLMLSSRRVGM